MEQFRLTPDRQASLRSLDQTIATLRETIKRAQSIGVEMGEYSERLEAAVRMRDGLIREFGNTVMPRP